MLSQGHTWDEILYLNFEDERLGSLDISDMDTILECHLEMGGVAKPALFLDEIHIPDDELAIQVSYSISNDKDAWEREVGALQKLPKAKPCKRRIIITYDEQQTIEDEYRKIEVIPCWKWLLGIE